MDKFNDIIKSKVDDYNPNPPDESLMVILTHLNKKNRMRRMYYQLGIAASFLVLVAFAGVYMYQTSNVSNINFSNQNSDNSITKPCDSLNNQKLISENNEVNTIQENNTNKNQNTTSIKPSNTKDIDSIVNNQKKQSTSINNFTDKQKNNKLFSILNFWKSIKSIYSSANVVISDNYLNKIGLDSVQKQYIKDESYFILNPLDTLLHYNFYHHDFYSNSYAIYNKDTLYSILADSNKFYKKHNSSANKIGDFDQVGYKSPYQSSIYSLPALISYLNDAINNLNSREIISFNQNTNPYTLEETYNILLAETFYQFDKTNKFKIKTKHKFLITVSCNSLLPIEALSNLSACTDMLVHPEEYEQYQSSECSYKNIIINKEYKNALWNYNDYLKKKRYDDSIKTIAFGKTTQMGFSLKGDIYYLYTRNAKLNNDSKLVGTIYTNTLHVPKRDFTLGFPGIIDRAEWFLIDYNAYFYIPDSGRYFFKLASDDGSLLNIDNRCIIDNWGEHGVQIIRNSTILNKGLHTINVRYYQGPKPWIALMLDISQDNLNYVPFNMRDYSPVDVIKNKDNINISIKDGVLFEFDSYTLDDISKSIIDEIKTFYLDKIKYKKIIIEGYTDDKGSDEYNMQLSIKRAESVKNWLVEKGIKTEYLISKGLGELMPKYPNTDENNRSKNRRIEIKILLK